MIRKHIKKGKSQAVEAAKKAAKQVGEEFAEIPKQAAREAVGKSDSGTSPIVEAMQLRTTNEEMGKGDNEGSPKKKLDYLEKELEDLKNKRDYENKQKEMLIAQEASKEEEKLKPLIEPPSKKKKGMPSIGKKKTKGTGELVKSKK